VLKICKTPHRSVLWEIFDPAEPELIGTLAKQEQMSMVGGARGASSAAEE
jgi:hypothetical protein